MSKGGIDLRTLSDANRIHVLKIIHEQKSISRTELAGMTGLSLSAVSRIVKQLIEDGFVLETGYGDSSGGRKPITIGSTPWRGMSSAWISARPRPMPGYSTSAVR